MDIFFFVLGKSDYLRFLLKENIFETNFVVNLKK